MIRSELDQIDIEVEDLEILPPGHVFFESDIIAVSSELGFSVRVPLFGDDMNISMPTLMTFVRMEDVLEDNWGVCPENKWEEFP